MSRPDRNAELFKATKYSATIAVNTIAPNAAPENNPIRVGLWIWKRDRSVKAQHASGSANCTTLPAEYRAGTAGLSGAAATKYNHAAAAGQTRATSRKPSSIRFRDMNHISRVSWGEEEVSMDAANPS